MCVCSLADGHVASGSRDSSIRIWDMASGQCVRVIEDAHKGPVFCLCALKGQCLCPASCLLGVSSVLLCDTLIKGVHFLAHVHFGSLLICPHIHVLSR